MKARDYEVRFVATLDSEEIVRRLGEITYSGIFLPGRRWINSPGKFVFEGKVDKAGFSIRRIREYKWLFPMSLGSWNMIEGKRIIVMRVDRRHITNLKLLAYTISGSIGLAILTVLIFGRDNGATMLSSYLIPASIIFAAYIFVKVIDKAARLKLEADCKYLMKIISNPDSQSYRQQDAGN